MEDDSKPKEQSTSTAIRGYFIKEARVLEATTNITGLESLALKDGDRTLANINFTYVPQTATPNPTDNAQN